VNGPGRGLHRDAVDAPARSEAPAESPRRPVGIAATPEEIAAARVALARGLRAFHFGQYPVAEAALKECMTLYPLLPEAHLTLGKIYLLRGLAAQDAKRLEKGRKLVVMALQIDPKLKAAAVFRELFAPFERRGGGE
jgi:tetratricopeptide (TPR) repeat protein